jgi:hypothetical protein
MLRTTLRIKAQKIRNISCCQQLNIHCKFPETKYFKHSISCVEGDGKSEILYRKIMFTDFHGHHVKFYQCRVLDYTCYALPNLLTEQDRTEYYTLLEL